MEVTIYSCPTQCVSLAGYTHTPHTAHTQSYEEQATSASETDLLEVSSGGRLHLHPGSGVPHFETRTDSRVSTMSPTGITPLGGPGMDHPPEEDSLCPAREGRAAVASGEPEAQEGTHPRATCRPGGQKVCEQGAEDPGGNGSQD